MSLPEAHVPGASGAVPGATSPAGAGARSGAAPGAAPGTATGAATGAATGTALRIEGVHKSFGTNHVLKGIDLAVDTHQVICLIGASGSGKSTLLRCVDLLETVEAGRIVFFGHDITSRDVDGVRVRRQMGMVFQSFNLFPHLRVLRNITLAPVKALGMDASAAEEEAMALLGRFGLADKARDYPDRLSGGQQQRVAIIRSLAMHPKLMLLDEVTSALDPELVGEVLDVIRELAGAGMTMLLATHEMGFARETATRVVFLEGGVIVEDGPPSQVLDAPHDERTRRFLGRVIEAGRM